MNLFGFLSTRLSFDIFLKIKNVLFVASFFLCCVLFAQRINRSV